MWNPNIEGVKELSRLFKESRSSDNWKQQEIYNVRNVFNIRKLTNTRKVVNSQIILFIY